MIDNLQSVIEVVERLSPDDQLELIATVSRGLQSKNQSVQFAASLQEFVPVNSIFSGINRTSPLKHLSQLKADFWPEDESVDDINNYIQQQRRDDLLREQDEYGTA
jgi:hypothetical protein